VYGPSDYPRYYYYPGGFGSFYYAPGYTSYVYAPTMSMYNPGRSGYFYTPESSYYPGRSFFYSSYTPNTYFAPRYMTGVSDSAYAPPPAQSEMRSAPRYGENTFIRRQ
jgi:hypothetical protein